MKISVLLLRHAQVIAQKAIPSNAMFTQFSSRKLYGVVTCDAEIVPMENPMKNPLLRYSLLALCVTAALYLRFTHAFLSPAEARNLASVSTLSACALYLLIGCLRGFTFVPLLVLIGAGSFFLPPVPLFALTMIGALISSAGIYYFSASFKLYEHLQRRNRRRLATIESGLKHHQLPIIIGWSFFPALPTDAICCVSGAMKLNILKLLFGVFIGEGLCSALYIFGSTRLLHLLHLGA
ncbi:VTT domain-containing protein [Edaphobacter flagellatus]|uniref:VTT domain-containing protein n=1 Tax=Edaphobacter flagellatus TaxID=1933044 RepID=UPI0021B4C0EE|nr:VTT domain-containing protein [Edaphobacter flagellatus]